MIITGFGELELVRILNLTLILVSFDESEDGDCSLRK